MTTVVYVHGINTRGSAYDVTFGQIRDALARRRPDVTLAPCRWGDDLGACSRAAAPVSRGTTRPRVPRNAMSPTFTCGTCWRAIR